VQHRLHLRLRTVRRGACAVTWHNCCAGVHHYGACRSPAVSRFACCRVAHSTCSYESETLARKRWSGVAALMATPRSARFQVALGDKPGDEPAAVSLVVKGQSTFIGTLRKAKCDQFSVRPRAAVHSRRGSCDG